MRQLGDTSIPIVPVDFTYHTPDRPFCWNEACPCHTDAEAIAQVKQQYDDGLISVEEVELIIKGKTV